MRVKTSSMHLSSWDTILPLYLSSVNLTRRNRSAWLENCLMTRFEISSTGELKYIVVGVTVADRTKAQYEGRCFRDRTTLCAKRLKMSLGSQKRPFSSAT